jgi:hypothetical protein
MTLGIWIDVETNKSLLRLREIKAMREVRNGKQTKIQDPFDSTKRKG